MKIFITGANGFIARRLISALTASGHSVTGYDLFNTTGELSYEHIQGDLCKGENLVDIQWQRYDVVVHLAAAGVKTPTRTWPLCSDVNIIGTQQLLYAMSTCDNPPALLHARSFYERHLWIDNESFHDDPYVVTKHLSSKLARLWTEQNPNRRLIFGTIFQGYGPGDDNANVLSYAAQCLRKRKNAQFGSGQVFRDWIYIDDLVDAFVASIKLGANNDWSGIREFDFGTGIITSLKDIVLKMAEACDGKDLLTFDPRLDRGDMALRDAATEFVPGWTPKIDLKTGLDCLLNSVD